MRWVRLQLVWTAEGCSWASLGRRDWEIEVGSFLLFLLADSETALADLALDLLRLLLMDHWTWLGMENIQKVFHLLFGTLIQR